MFVCRVPSDGLKQNVIGNRPSTRTAALDTPWLHGHIGCETTVGSRGMKRKIKRTPEQIAKERAEAHAALMSVFRYKAGDPVGEARIKAVLDFTRMVQARTREQAALMPQGIGKAGYSLRCLHAPILPGKRGQAMARAAAKARAEAEKAKAEAEAAQERECVSPLKQNVIEKGR
jgi:hypothetical protein